MGDPPSVSGMSQVTLILPLLVLITCKLRGAVGLSEKKQINFILMYVNNGTHLFQSVFARILPIENHRFKPYLHVKPKSLFLSAILLIFLMFCKQ